MLKIATIFKFEGCNQNCKIIFDPYLYFFGFNYQNYERKLQIISLKIMYKPKNNNNNNYIWKFVCTLKHSLGH